MDISENTRMSRHGNLPFLEVKTGTDKAYALRKHSHDTLSVGFIEKGSSRILCHALEFDLSLDQTILIPPNAVHLCEPMDPDKFRFRMLFVNPQWINETYGLDPTFFQAQTASLPQKEVGRKNDFFKEFETGQGRLPDETNSIFFIARLLFNIFCLDPAPKAPLIHRKTMERIKTYMDNHFTQDIQLIDLENLVEISKFSILRQFKKTFKLTPHAYLINKRINLAKSLLTKGHTVADTAVECGFFDQSHFVKTFKNFVGINPTAYK